MPTVDCAEWVRFFEAFTRQHAHWQVRVDGERTSLPLAAVVAREDGRVTITLGDDISHHRRIVIDAAAIRVEGNDIEIESGDHHTTRLAFVKP